MICIHADISPSTSMHLRLFIVQASLLPSPLCTSHPAGWLPRSGTAQQLQYWSLFTPRGSEVLHRLRQHMTICKKYNTDRDSCLAQHIVSSTSPARGLLSLCQPDIAHSILHAELLHRLFLSLNRPHRMRQRLVLHGINRQSAPCPVVTCKSVHLLSATLQPTSMWSWNNDQSILPKKNHSVTNSMLSGDNERPTLVPVTSPDKQLALPRLEHYPCLPASAGK